MTNKFVGIVLKERFDNNIRDNYITNYYERDGKYYYRAIVDEANAEWRMMATNEVEWEEEGFNKWYATIKEGKTLFEEREYTKEEIEEMIDILKELDKKDKETE